MKLYKDIEKLKNTYKIYAQGIFEKINADKLGNDILLKVNHGLSMSDAVRTTTLQSGFFNSSYGDSGAVDGLLHDIGRFEQYLLSGTLKDAESKSFTGFEDHGQFGKFILSRNNDELLRAFLPDNDSYDYILKEVVGEHTTISNEKYKLPLETLINIFQNYDLQEIINSSNEDMINKLIALKLMILREEDSLEILQKVKDELWKPDIGSEEKHHIKDEPWEIFTNLGYLNMSELKGKGVWSCNAGFLLRYSLLFNNVNFVGTLKRILSDGTIETIYKNQINNVTNDANELVTDPSLIDPRLKLAYLYTVEAVKTLIETSLDGKIITEESRELARQKMLTTKKNM